MLSERRNSAVTPASERPAVVGKWSATDVKTATCGPLLGATQAAVEYGKPIAEIERPRERWAATKVECRRRSPNDIEFSGERSESAATRG